MNAKNNKREVKLTLSTVPTPTTKGWGNKLITQLSFARLRLAYPTLGKLTKGAGAYIQLLETVGRATGQLKKRKN